MSEQLDTLGNPEISAQFTNLMQLWDIHHLTIDSVVEQVNSEKDKLFSILESATSEQLFNVDDMVLAGADYPANGAYEDGGQDDDMLEFLSIAQSEAAPAMKQRTLSNFSELFVDADEGEVMSSFRSQINPGSS